MKLKNKFKGFYLNYSQFFQFVGLILCNVMITFILIQIINNSLGDYYNNYEENFTYIILILLIFLWELYITRFSKEVFKESIKILHFIPILLTLIGNIVIVLLSSFIGISLIFMVILNFSILTYSGYLSMKIPDVLNFKQEISSIFLPKLRYYILSGITSVYFIITQLLMFYSNIDAILFFIILGFYTLLTILVLHLEQDCSIKKLIWETIIIGFFTFFVTGLLTFLNYDNSDVWLYILSFIIISFYSWKIIIKRINIKLYIEYNENNKTDSVNLPKFEEKESTKIQSIQINRSNNTKMFLLILGSAVFSTGYFSLLFMVMDSFDEYGYFAFFGLILMALWQFFIQGSFSRKYLIKIEKLRTILPILGCFIFNIIDYAYIFLHSFSYQNEYNDFLSILLISVNLIVLTHSGLLGLRRIPHLSIAKNEITQISLKKTVSLAIITGIFFILIMITIGIEVEAGMFLIWAIYAITASIVFHVNQNFSIGKKLLNTLLITILSFFTPLLLYMPTHVIEDFLTFLVICAILLSLPFYLWIFIIRQVNYSRLEHSLEYYKNSPHKLYTINQEQSPEVQIIRNQDHIYNLHCPVCKGPIEPEYLDVLRKIEFIYCVFCGSKIHRQEIFPPDTEHLMREHEHILEKISKLQPINEINPEVK